jgi:hypothetical protein
VGAKGLLIEATSASILRDRDRESHGEELIRPPGRRACLNGISDLPIVNGEPRRGPLLGSGGGDAFHGPSQRPPAIARQ